MRHRGGMVLGISWPSTPSLGAWWGCVLKIITASVFRLWLGQQPGVMCDSALWLGQKSTYGRG